MSRSRVAVLVTLAFCAGLAAARLGPSASAQGAVTELKRVDLGAWCPGKEAIVSLEEIAPQHQSKHFHPAYSFAWMIEGSQRRFVEGKAPETFQKGDVTQENPNEVSESDILTPTKVLLFRILEKGKPPTTRVR